MSGGLRNPRIDLIRGVSILLVLFHHFNIAYPLNDTSLATMLGWNTVHAIARNGNYGVTMFFVISGFLITSNAKRRWSTFDRVDYRAFYALRFARVAPCLLLLLAAVNLFAAAGVAIFQNRAPAGMAVSFWTVNLVASQKSSEGKCRATEDPESGSGQVRMDHDASTIIMKNLIARLPREQCFLIR
jgi:peptidoglycan/LPS O-acetylase OafA/YrhL